MIPTHVQRAFNLKAPAILLEGGTRDVYLVGDLIVKQLLRTTFENPHTFQLFPWLADHLSRLRQEGFRLSCPVLSVDEEWIVQGGWTAWTYVEGNSITSEDVPAAIESIQDLHLALKEVPKHHLLEQSENAWGFAHKHCFGDRPVWIHPLLADLVDELYALRLPLPPMTSQLIHGDLNQENILISPGTTVGFIDLTPFWAPVDFALAMFANWLGPRRGDVSILQHFEDIPYFNQLLLRASIRMLLVVSHLEGVEGWQTSLEKRAAGILLEYIKQ